MPEYSKESHHGLAVFPKPKDALALSFGMAYDIYLYLIEKAVAWDLLTMIWLAR